MEVLKKKRIAVVFIIVLSIIIQVIISFADDSFNPATQPFEGLPKVTINVSNLDTSGNLIYCGVDIAVFWDDDKDGKFTVVPDDSKIMRYITKSTNITFDLGPLSSYRKGIQYKLAMRTLYVPTGTKQETIIIADFNNGNEGWVEIPGTPFIPTYFINPEDNPYINHTTKWDDNLETYNTVKESIGNKASVRSKETFWSGEKFVLHVETAEIVSGVAITILDELSNNNQPYKTVLTEYKPNSIISGGAIYEGEIWDESMFNKWGNYTPKELQFKLEILGADSKTLEEKVISVVIDNTDLYYRSRRQY